MNQQLPVYAQGDIKQKLLASGVSGTVYALVMPEVSQVISNIVDGKLDGAFASEGQVGRDHWLQRYDRAWEARQDLSHELYFDTWEKWAAPIVGIGPAAFKCRYPTAGASEGIYNLIAEFARTFCDNPQPSYLHMFKGDYEGFSAFAESLGLVVVRHNRKSLRMLDERGILDGHAMNESNRLFMLSQPSAIDGNVWPEFPAFVSAMARHAPKASIIPDLTYVGATCNVFRIVLDSPNIPAFVMSQSKPFGVYYHRIGGVYSRKELPSLFGNKWFKNLLSIDIGIEVMKAFSVTELPNRYRSLANEAFTEACRHLELQHVASSDVFMLAMARTKDEFSALDREGSGRMRLCLTPGMKTRMDEGKDNG